MSGCGGLNRGEPRRNAIKYLVLAVELQVPAFLVSIVYRIGLGGYAGTCSSKMVAGALLTFGRLLRYHRLPPQPLRLDERLR